MSLSTAEIEAVVADLAPRLEGGEIARIDQPDQWRLILHVLRDSKRYWLQFVAHPRFSRLHLLTRRPREGKPAGGLCNVARQHLSGAPLLRLRQIPDDRVVILESVERDAMLRPSPVRLIAEFVGPGSNLILVDSEDRILGAMFTRRSERRRIAPGEVYAPPAPPPGRSSRAQSNRFADIIPDGTQDELALSRAVQDAYRQAEAQAALDDRRSGMLALVRRRRKALGSRCRNLQQDLQRADDSESLRRAGELLTISLPDIRRGQASIVVQDVFEADAPERTIELDPKLSPEDNVQRYFARYKKLKAGREHMQARLKQATDELDQLAALASDLEGAAEGGALDALEERVRAAGLAPREQKPPGQKASLGPRRFLSADGMEILVARNSRENHRLTFSIARGNDYWMHLQKWSGPHVVIRKPRDKDVPLETLLDAAHLAVHFSRIRGADFAEVVYTQRKHVRPVKGAGPGRVHHAGGSALSVHVEKERLRRLLQSRPMVGG